MKKIIDENLQVGCVLDCPVRDTQYWHANPGKWTNDVAIPAKQFLEQIVFRKCPYWSSVFIKIIKIS